MWLLLLWDSGHVHSLPVVPGDGGHPEEQA